MTETEPVSRCPNCNAPRPGAYCAVCGQNDRNYLRAAHRIIGEILSESFELDSRLLVTLRRLCFSPGYLSREFSAGRRARYVSPVRLYLVASLIFFFCFSILGRGEIVLDGESGNGDVGIVIGDSSQGLEDLEGRVPEEDLAKLRKSLDEARIQKPETEFERALDERIAAARENPDTALDRFFDNLPIMMFLMLPVTAALLKLFYRQRYYSEHLVFALHVHAFIFLVFTVALFIPGARSDGTDAAGWWGHLETVLDVVCVGYVLAALKGFYGQTLVRTLLKAAAISALYLVLLGVGLVTVLLMAIWFA